MKKTILLLAFVISIITSCSEEQEYIYSVNLNNTVWCYNSNTENYSITFYDSIAVYKKHISNYTEWQAYKYIKTNNVVLLKPSVNGMNNIKATLLYDNVLEFNDITNHIVLILYKQ